MTSGWDLSREEYQWRLRDGWLPDRDYVFVSYSSRDWDKVYPCVMAMRARGINVYIDIEFMENQSSSWLKNFQERLFRDSGCKGIVSFLSINYMRSYACLVEQMANRTNKMRKRMGKPLPMFYVALDSELGTLQQMSAHIYTDRIRRESVSERVEISPQEYMVLQKFILDSRIDGYRSEESVQELLDDIHDKHDVVTTMHELIFCSAADMPSIQVFEGVEKCAQLLTDNFTNSKNDSIKLAVLEDLKRATRERMGGAAMDEPPAGQEEGAEPPKETPPQQEQREESEDSPSQQDPMLEALMEAAERGVAAAQSRLGLLYRQGQGVEQSYTQAEKWFRKAAEQNDVNGQFRLGLLYRKGQGIERSNVEAIKWFQKAAEQGHADAQFRLGLMYRKGKGVMRSPEKAVYWYRKAAEHGHGSALRELELLAEQGVTIDGPDPEPPAGRKEEPALPKERPSRPEQREEAAADPLDPLRRAAERGGADAQFKLASKYQHGQGVAQSLAQAVKWYCKAAEQGHAGAQYNVGLLYRNGKGIEQSYEQAAKWLRKAAEQSYAGAQYELGVLYQKGLGVEQSEKQMAYWYRKAAEQGHVNAKKQLAALNKKGG